MKTSIVETEVAIIYSDGFGIPLSVFKLQMSKGITYHDGDAEVERVCRNRSWEPLHW